MPSARQNRLVRAVVAVLGVAVLAGLGVALGQVLQDHKGASAPTASAPTAVPALTQADEARISAGLTSTDVTSESLVLTPEVRGSYLAHPSSLLPIGSTVTLEIAKTRYAGSVASVPATVTGPRPGRYDVLLVNEDGGWLVYATRTLS